MAHLHEEHEVSDYDSDILPLPSYHELQNPFEELHEEAQRKGVRCEKHTRNCLTKNS